MEAGEPEAVVSELKRQMEDEELSPEQKVNLLNAGLNKVFHAAALHPDGSALTRVKSQLYLSGVLSHCVAHLSLHPRRLRGNWSAAATLATLTSSCCVGVDAGEHSEAFHRLFLPSVMDGLLSLASRLSQQPECASVLRKLFDSVGWLLRVHSQLSSQVLSSVHYEQIQTCDDVTVSLLCVQLWTQTCTYNRDFVSGLSDDSLLLLLNEAVCQLAVSSDPAVGGASVRLILLMANQQERRVHPLLLLSFRGLDRLLDKDWRGRGLDHDLDQLITFIQSDRSTTGHGQACAERVQAACAIQAAWRSYQRRRRVKGLSRAVSTLQRRYRARRRQQEQLKEAQRWEEELKYQVCVRRRQARREFYQKQRQLLQLLPAAQVQAYLQECERRAAVVIQSFWRGFRDRKRYNTQRPRLRHEHRQQRAARTLQRAVRRFLQRRRAAKILPIKPLWIGQKGLTDSRRAELKREVEEYVAAHPSSRVSLQECERLHEEVQLLLLSALRRGGRQRREEERIEALVAHTHTQLELLRDAPPLSVVTATDAESFLSPSGLIAARARDSHNATLQASRLPWWRALGETADVDVCSPAHQQELEAELGGLFVGGVSGLKL